MKHSHATACASLQHTNTQIHGDKQLLTQGSGTRRAVMPMPMPMLALSSGSQALRPEELAWFGREREGKGVG